MEKGKDLHSLIRLARWTVDEVQRTLGVLVEREEKLVTARYELDEELKREQAAAAENIMEGGLTFSGYIRRYQARRDDLDHKIAEVAREILEARDALAEAYRDQKTYELAQETRDIAWNQELARREQISLDEIAQTLHRRRGQQGEG